jgi:predicted nucleotidyltransferase
MNDLSGELPIDLLEAVDRVVAAVMPHAPGLKRSEIGTTARDLHHHTLGHQFSTAATQDLDLALARPTRHGGVAGLRRP